MRRMLKYLGPLAGLALLTAACSDTLGTGDPLSSEDAVEVADFMAASAIDGYDAIGTMGPSPEAGGPMTSSGFTFTKSFTLTRSCPAGGSLTVAGTVNGELDQETRSGTINVEKTIALNECARSRGEHTLTLNTAEDAPISVEGVIEVQSGHHVSGSFTKQGSFTWSKSNGDSGSCELDLAITWSRDGNTFTHTVTGTICSREVNRTTTRTKG